MHPLRCPCLLCMVHSQECTCMAVPIRGINGTLRAAARQTHGGKASCRAPGGYPAAAWRGGLPQLPVLHTLRIVSQHSRSHFHLSCPRCQGKIPSLQQVDFALHRMTPPWQLEFAATVFGVLSCFRMFEPCHSPPPCAPPFHSLSVVWGSS